MPSFGPDRQVRARELTNVEIVAKEAVVAEQVESMRRTMESTEALLKGDPLDKKLQDTLTAQKFLLTFKRRELFELRTEYATRPALSFGCLFFVLIGCPVAIWFQRRDYLSAFVTCFLPIIVMYYPLIMLGINLGKEGRVEPLYFMWVGNGVMGLIGMLLLWRLGRH
jgi:lipopolysaccharide export LptBFGC system permease protein LptF